MDLDFPKEQLGEPIITGSTYRYMMDLPVGCRGGLYRVERFVRDVPSYQEKVLVHCISGQDVGLWFVVSPENFVRRYEQVPSPST